MNQTIRFFIDGSSEPLFEFDLSGDTLDKWNATVKKLAEMKCVMPESIYAFIAPNMEE